MPTETELPWYIELLLISLQLIALAVFIYLVWPHFKKEHWKAKFIDNPIARSIIIVFILILLLVFGLGEILDLAFEDQVLH
ncbi:hypothetical protein [Thiomicrorhabdus sediminis]|uniref:DUF1146 domain-containing protein n=1 Tax=Thiomicrorhabdus sediminis TaxID=2580412 RepID=A0A4P9K5E7_9GAMM|nr:hypothetical protein [Thiomicrorhabdus sediminis]QCU90202.1 hypothetical protein FE785_05945 [Thiomicrorhabdus sediminis]